MIRIHRIRNLISNTVFLLGESNGCRTVFVHTLCHAGAFCIYLKEIHGIVVICGNIFRLCSFHQERYTDQFYKRTRHIGILFPSALNTHFIDLGNNTRLQSVYGISCVIVIIFQLGVIQAYIKVYRTILCCHGKDNIHAFLQVHGCRKLEVYVLIHVGEFDHPIVVLQLAGCRLTGFQRQFIRRICYGIGIGSSIGIYIEHHTVEYTVIGQSRPRRCHIITVQHNTYIFNLFRTGDVKCI